MPLAIALIAAVFCRTQRRITARPAAQAQSPAGKMGVGLERSLRCELITFQPTAKIHTRRLIRNRIMPGQIGV